MAGVSKRGDSYRITVSLGYDGKGKQIRKSITWTPTPGMTKRQIEKELERQKVLFEEKCNSGQLLDSSIRFADFAEYWMTEYAEKQLRASTVTRYRDMIGRILPTIGHIHLDHLQPHHLMELYTLLGEQGIRNDVKYAPIVDIRAYLKERGLTQAELARRAQVSISVVSATIKGQRITTRSAEKLSSALGMPLKTLFQPTGGEKQPLSAKTILHHHRLISSILEKAVKWQIILSNPCARVEVPKVEYKEAKYLDEKQAVKLLRCLQDEPLKYRTMITLLLYTGMRRGELCGLEWSDIDFEECIINIDKSSLYIHGKGVIEDTTKTCFSKRVIKVPSQIMEILSEYKRDQMREQRKLGDLWVNSNKLFTQWNGKPIHPDTITGWFKKFIERNNLPESCVHSLRHTNATLMVASGVDLRTVSKRLGHSNMTTTGNIYTHAIQTADERAANAIGDILVLEEESPKIKRKLLAIS